MSHVIRPATASDLDAIGEVIAEQLEPEDVPEAAYTLEGPLARPGDWLVAEVDGEVAAFCLGCPCSARVGSVTMPALNIEFVATKKGFEGRGLQRALFAALSEVFPDALLHMITGIAYFYRRLGYEYAIPVPDRWSLPTFGVPDGWSVRTADAGDIAQLMALQARVQDRADVAFTHTADQWAWLLPSPNYRTVIAEGPDGPAMARAYTADADRAWVFEVSAPSPDGARAAVAGAAEGFERVDVYERPADRDDIVGTLGGDRHKSSYAYYLKVLDIAAVLSELGPELTRRLAASGIEAPESLKLDFYTSAFEIPISDGEFGDPQVIDHATYAADRIAVPPDLVAHLLLGPLGAEVLDERHPDIRTRERGSLFRALFPPLVGDLHSWIVP